MTRKEFLQSKPFTPIGGTGIFRYAEEQGGEIERLTTQTIKGEVVQTWVFVTNVVVINERWVKVEIPSLLNLPSLPIAYEDLIIL